MTVRLKTWEELGQIDGYKLDEANDRIVSYNDNYQLTHKRYDLVKEQEQQYACDGRGDYLLFSLEFEFFLLKRIATCLAVRAA